MTKTGANDKIVIGLIGCGGMGAQNMRTLMDKPEISVAALCDVDKDRMPGDINDVTKSTAKRPTSIPTIARCWSARTLTP